MLPFTSVYVIVLLLFFQLTLHKYQIIFYLLLEFLSYNVVPARGKGKKTGAYVYDGKTLNNLNLCLYVTGHVCTYGNVCFSLPGM